MKRRIAMLLAVGALALVPSLAGAHGDDSTATVGNYYVASGPSLWEESNGDAGLQTSGHCHKTEKVNGVDVCVDYRNADTRIA